jgi:VanZ family protein
MKKSLIYPAAVVAYMIIIFALSSLPQEHVLLEFPIFPTVSSVIKHMVEYFILSLLLSLWLMNRGRGVSSPFSIFILAVLIASAYGITDELHQAFVPTRFCDVWDVASNFFGSILVAPIVVKFHMPKNKSGW